MPMLRKKQSACWALGATVGSISSAVIDTVLKEETAHVWALRVQPLRKRLVRVRLDRQRGLHRQHLHACAALTTLESSNR